LTRDLEEFIRRHRCDTPNDRQTVHHDHRDSNGTKGTVPKPDIYPPTYAIEPQRARIDARRGTGAADDNTAFEALDIVSHRVEALGETLVELIAETTTIADNNLS